MGILPIFEVKNDPNTRILAIFEVKNDQNIRILAIFRSKWPKYPYFGHIDLKNDQNNNLFFLPILENTGILVIFDLKNGLNGF